MKHAAMSRAMTLVLGIASCQVLALAQSPKYLHDSASPDFQKPAASGALAPHLKGLGDHGFNHQEAGRAFSEAARLDPECAMAYWGQALVLGPNINIPMAADNEPKAYELVQKAVARKSKASAREAAYIDALVQRYSGKPDDRKERDRAYADAMREVHNKYPEDLDAATLFAESLMDLRPWNYWTNDLQPYPQTTEIVNTLEQVLKRDLNHPGANHYYIHVMELPSPEQAEAAADRLQDLMPGAGHIVHMAAHIYQRVGRYADARAANQRAILADEGYIAQCRAQGIYPVTYYPHNIHFLWNASTMEGRSEVAIDSARKTAAQIPADTLAKMPLLEGFLVVPYYALTRFGKWSEILREPKPTHDSPFVNGVWHYARGMTYTGLGEFEKAGEELRTLRSIAASPELAQEATWSANSAPAILSVATEALAGELAARKGDHDKAIARLDKAVRLEDALDYVEPPDWHYPVRHSLGAALLDAGRPLEAEVVYWEDLRRNPENGWALFGLMESLRAQGKKDQAAAVEARFRKAWARSDVTLTASRF